MNDEIRNVRQEKKLNGKGHLECIIYHILQE
jgi:hypothetical protein